MDNLLTDTCAQRLCSHKCLEIVPMPLCWRVMIFMYNSVYPQLRVDDK